MQVEYNAVLLVVNYLAKIIDLQVFFAKGNPHKDFLLDFQNQHW